MQQFKLVVLVTVNTTDTVSTTEVKEAVQEMVDDFFGGTIEIQEVVEV
jgi:hypothetical protein